LRPINDICFDDGYFGLVHENCQLHFIHEEVKNEFGMIEALGIMSKISIIKTNVIYWPQNT
jgi:hypothetical protein